MKKLSFILTIVIALIVAGCQPAKPGGYDAPSKNNETGEVPEVTIHKGDSSVEKSVLHKTPQDSLKSK